MSCVLRKEKKNPFICFNFLLLLLLPDSVEHPLSLAL